MVKTAELERKFKKRVPKAGIDPAQTDPQSVGLPLSYIGNIILLEPNYVIKNTLS